MFNICIEMAIKEKWWYAYVLPTYAQGKKIIWDSIDKQWKKFKDHIPKEILVWENWTELKFTLANGSFIQILGSENVDTIRWISPKWIVFSEYAFHNPMVWDSMRPILKENWGWAIFNSTPNGKNHFYDMFNMAEENPKWYSQKLTVLDTLDENWNRIVTDEDINEERLEWMSEEMIQQEYFCSFDVWAIWSYYAEQVNQARDDSRICDLPYNPDVPTDLYFDLWVNDAFTISFKQTVWQFYNFVNYYEENWKTLEHYFNYIDDYIARKNWKVGFIYLPHDANQKAHSFLVSWLTIIDKFKEKYWSHKVVLIPNSLSINDWIQEVRKVFPRIRFDINNCTQLIRCLENYKKDYDEKKKVFRDQPRHDWASHWADNIRYFAISPKNEIVIPSISIETDYSQFL